MLGSYHSCVPTNAGCLPQLGAYQNSGFRGLKTVDFGVSEGQNCTFSGFSEGQNCTFSGFSGPKTVVLRGFRVPKQWFYGVFSQNSGFSAKTVGFMPKQWYGEGAGCRIRGAVWGARVWCRVSVWYTRAWCTRHGPARGVPHPLPCTEMCSPGLIGFCGRWAGTPTQRGLGNL